MKGFIEYEHAEYKKLYKASQWIEYRQSDYKIVITVGIAVCPSLERTGSNT